MIVNGGMDIWQVGESFSFDQDVSVRAADAWYFITAVPGCKMGKSADVPPGLPVTSSLKITVPSEEWSILRQYVPNTPGAVLTFSAWVKGTAGTVGFMDIYDNPAAGFTFTGDWQFVTLTGPMPDSLGAPCFCDVLNMNSAGEFYITAVTLGPGNVPLPYTPQNYVQLLEDCRYRYVKLPAHSHFGGFVPNNESFMFPMPYTMRSLPYLVNNGMSVRDKWGSVVSDITSFGVNQTGNEINIFATKQSHGLTEAWLYIDTDSALDCGI
jgi:hypothetical protein